MDSILFPDWTPADVYQFMLKHYEYNDGGAFAEIHVPQFPNSVGLSSIVATNSSTLATSVTANTSGAANTTQPLLLLTSSSQQAAQSQDDRSSQAPILPSVPLSSSSAVNGGALISMPALPDISRLSKNEEATLRKAQGGLLVIHTPESALTTKSFTAAELQKPPEEVIRKNVEATREALAALLAERDSKGVGGGMSRQQQSNLASENNGEQGAAATSSQGAEKHFSHNPFLPNAIAAKQQSKMEHQVGRGPQPRTSGALAIIVPSSAGNYAADNTANAVSSAYSTDPAPILRSPTKRQAIQHRSEATFGGSGSTATASAAGGTNIFASTPAVVNNYRNKKGIIFSLGQRSSAQGATSTTETVELNSRHFDVAKSLSAAQKELETTAAANLKAKAEADRRAREREEAEVTRMAQEALEARAAAMTRMTTADQTTAPRSSAATPVQRETREQRAKRIQAEREAREEEAAEERREKRLEKAAQRLGIAKEVLFNDKDLLEKVNTSYAAGVGGEADGVRDAEGDMVDPRIMMLANSNKGKFGGSADISSLLSGEVATASDGTEQIQTTSHQAAAISNLASLHSNSRIEAELERQRQAAKESGGGARVSGSKRQAEGNSDDSSDDDVFGLQKKHHRKE